MNKQELQDKITKMKKGLDNPAIQGETRKTLEVAITNALKQLSELSKEDTFDLSPPPGPDVARGIDHEIDLSLFKKGKTEKRVSISDYPLTAMLMPIHQKNLVKNYDDDDKRQILESIEANLSQLGDYGSQDGKGRQAMVYAHYFYGNSDWFVTEKDFDEDYKNLYGFAIIGGDSQNGELGSIGLDQLVNSSKVELDFYWKPVTLAEALHDADPEYFPLDNGNMEDNTKSQGQNDENTMKTEEDRVKTEPVMVEPPKSSICNVTRNLRQNGIEIKFPKQPGDEIIARIKAKGFRWSKFQKLWYAKYSESLHQFAIDICGETEHTTSPGSIGNLATGNDPNIRVITMAALTSKGKVPQNILRDEIKAGKLEMARFKKFNGMTDSTDYYSDDELDWRDATMDDDAYDIKRLKNNGANTHYTDSIYLNDNGIITYSDLKFRYKTSVKGHDYNPKAEREKINEIQQLEDKIKTDTAARVIDLSPQQWHIPFNRLVKNGTFKILENEALQPDDFIDKGVIPGIVEVDGYRLTGTMEARNVVTSVMTELYSGKKTENRENRWVFSPEPGTALPAYLSLWSRYRQLREGEKSDFPGWKFASFPTSVWSNMRYAAREAVAEQAKMNQPGKTDRSKKIHLGKMNESIKRLTLMKKVWMEYESSHPGLLIQVTGQDQAEYQQMMALWRNDLGLSELPAQVAPVIEKEPETALADKKTPWILGKKRPITLPNGEKHEAQYAIVELDTILASHNELTFADTPGYPRNSLGGNLNDRNYATDRGAQQLVEEYARNLNPELLIALTSTPEGTPIITPDGFVVSGNNRTMSLKLAQKKYEEKWRAYQATLQNESDVFGFNNQEDWNALAEMKAPVLVRIDYDFGELTTTNMAKYNASSMKAKSPVDKAAELATTLREQILCETNISKIIGEFDTLSDFYADRGAIKRMVTAMQQCSVLNEQDMPAYVENGYFTEDGKTLLETILASLILEPDTLRIANRDGVRSFRQAVVNALPVLIANKNLDTTATLIPDINKAIRYQGEVVASGLTWENFVNQLGIFSEERASCNTVYINRLMNEGQRIFRDAIRKYNESQVQAGGVALFAAEVVTPDEAFNGYIISKLSSDTVKRIEQYCSKKTVTDAVAIAPPAFEKGETVWVVNPESKNAGTQKWLIATVAEVNWPDHKKPVYYKLNVENGKVIMAYQAAMKKYDIEVPSKAVDKKQLAQTRLKLLEKSVGRLSGDKKRLAETRIKLLSKFLQK